jgi:hypothetical protein
LVEAVSFKLSRIFLAVSFQRFKVKAAIPFRMEWVNQSFFGSFDTI